MGTHTIVIKSGGQIEVTEEQYNSVLENWKEFREMGILTVKDKNGYIYHVQLGNIGFMVNN